MGKTTTIEKLCSVCYQLEDGRVRTMKKEATYSEGKKALKKFDRMYSRNSSLLQGISHMYLQPLKKTRITEK